jgi:tRNA modification GTPase
MPTRSDTIAALATPVGTAAIAVVRASGPDSVRLMAEIFGSAPPRSVVHCDYRDRHGVLLDDTLAVFFQGPHSYTGEDSLEVSCHGNPFIAQKILEDLLARGCRAAGPGEFTQRAWLNGRLDLSQAEAVMDLIGARSERALAAAHQQLRGALGRQVAALTDELLLVLARIEAYIDFPDEDLPPENRAAVRAALQRVAQGADRLLATSHYGTLLRDGIRTVIVGEPNAGKSSLLNRLVGHERALVGSEPGTTRDFIEERLSAGPHWLRLIDTAGLNPDPGPIERRGIEKTMENAAAADLVLLVLDSNRPTPPLPTALQALLCLETTIVVLNKSDLLPPGSAPVAQGPAGYAALAVSALTGEGIDALMAEIVNRAEAFRQDTGEDLIAINARHAEALARARAGLTGALAKLADSSPAELLASDLRDALDALGEIAGRVDHERMLDHLFAHFCIGK